MSMIMAGRGFRGFGSRVASIQVTARSYIPELG
jgi:hypothetical protein